MKDNDGLGAAKVWVISFKPQQRSPRSHQLQQLVHEGLALVIVACLQHCSLDVRTTDHVTQTNSRYGFTASAGQKLLNLGSLVPVPVVSVCGCAIGGLE